MTSTGHGVALAMRHRHRGLSTYRLNDQRQGDEHPQGVALFTFIDLLYHPYFTALPQEDRNTQRSCPSVRLSVCLSPVRPSVYLSPVRPSVRPSVRLPVCPISPQRKNVETSHVMKLLLFARVTDTRFWADNEWVSIVRCSACESAVIVRQSVIYMLTARSYSVLYICRKIRWVRVSQVKPSNCLRCLE